MKMNYSFLIFLSIFLTLYGLLHFYFYWKIIKAFHPPLLVNIFIIMALCFLMLSPITMRMMDGKSPEIVCTAITYTGYLWMGIIFLLFSFNLIVDIYNFLIFLFSKIFYAPLVKLTPDRKIIFYLIISLIAFINVYGFYEAGSIRTAKITLETDKLPPDTDSFRIVQISDIHFSRTNGLKLARKITAIVKDLRPDLLVSTGDLIDEGLENIEEVQSLFRDIDTRYGKYASTGNHEFITGIEKTTKFTEDCGFKLLRNEVTEIDNFLGIATIDDPAAGRDRDISLPDEVVILDKLSDDRLNLFLKHQPRIDPESIGKFDLQLSGHTHDGQIFPFRLIVGLVYKYMYGFYDLGSDSFLYVTRGTGTWGPPVRFLSPPEIAVIDFVRKNNIIKSGR